MAHPLNSLHQHFEQKDFPLNELNGLEYFQYCIVQKVIESFMAYPTLDTLYFNFETILRISKVWEGSNATTVELGTHMCDLLEDENYVPFISSKKESLLYLNYIEEKQKDLSQQAQYKKLSYPLNYSFSDKNHHNLTTLVSYDEYYKDVYSKFDFLTEEPSFLEDLVSYLKSNHLSTSICFTHLLIENNSFNHRLENEIYRFICPSLKIKLNFHKLNNQTDYTESYQPKFKI